MTGPRRRDEAEIDADQVIEVVGAIGELIAELAASRGIKQRNMTHALAGALAFQAGYHAQEGRGGELYDTLTSLGRAHVSLGEASRRRDQGAGHA